MNKLNQLFPGFLFELQKLEYSIKGCQAVNAFLQGLKDEFFTKMMVIRFCLLHFVGQCHPEFVFFCNTVWAHFLLTKTAHGFINLEELQANI